MFFVVDKPRLQRLLSIVRQDVTPALKGKNSPFVRIEAAGNRLTIASGAIEAAFPATVHEEGVVFLRTTLFRKALTGIPGEKQLAIQIDGRGLHMDNIFISHDAADMILFPIPKQAPRSWPAPLPESEQPPPEKGLFD